LVRLPAVRPDLAAMAQKGPGEIDVNDKAGADRPSMPNTVGFWVDAVNALPFG
jgi:hypothetical protein